MSSDRINRIPIHELPNIYQITLPTPWRGAFVQIYLIDSEPMTLIDTGVNWTPSFTGLKEAFEAAGLPLTGIKRIIGTHFHSDHMGQAQTLRELGSPIEIVAHETEIPSIEGFFSSYISKRENRAELYHEYGMPDDVLEQQSTIEKKWLQNDPPLLRETLVDRGLKDGDKIGFNDFDLTVFHAPGHTEGHIVLFEEKSGTLFSGDHIMGGDVPFTETFYLSDTIVPGDAMRRKPHFHGLRKYLDSLSRLKRLEVRTVLPGHGPIIHKMDRAIDASTRFYRMRIKRVEQVLKSMTESGQKVTAWDMWDTLYRKLELGGIFRRRMTMLIGILDILEQTERCLSARRDDGILVHQYV